MEIIRKKDNIVLFKELWNTFIKNNEAASHCEIQINEYYLITKFQPGVYIHQLFLFV